MNDLPLLELFTKLREAGLPLGIDEYKLVLQAMQAGFGINDQAALKRLCQTLWIKSAEDKQLFESYFEEVMSSKAVSPMSEILVMQSQQPKISQIGDYIMLGIFGVLLVLGFGLSLQKPNETQNLPPTAQLNKTQNLPPTAQLNETQNLPPTAPDLIAWSVLSIIRLSFVYISLRRAAQFKVEDGRTDHRTSFAKQNLSKSVTPLPTLTQVIEDEVQVVQAVLQNTSRNEGTSYSRFIMTTEFFHVTERQIKLDFKEYYSNLCC